MIHSEKQTPNKETTINIRIRILVKKNLSKHF